MKKTNSSEALKDFIEFCEENPELRFWQAICAWSDSDRITLGGLDPYYWEGKNK